MGTLWVPIDGKMDKENVLYIYVFICTYTALLSHKKEWSPTIWDNIDGYECYAMLNESDEKKNKYCMISLVSGIVKKKKNEQTKQKLTDRETISDFQREKGLRRTNGWKGQLCGDERQPDLCWGSLCSEHRNERKCCTFKTHIKKKKMGKGPK